MVRGPRSVIGALTLYPYVHDFIFIHYIHTRETEKKPIPAQLWNLHELVGTAFGTGPRNSIERIIFQQLEELLFSVESRSYREGTVVA